MSDERPVEELIGWERVDCDVSRHDGRWMTHDGRIYADRAEVDDLIAWLGDRLEMMSKVRGGKVAVDVMTSAGPRVVYAGSARDALVAAVRKVAGQ